MYFHGSLLNPFEDTELLALIELYLRFFRLTCVNAQQLGIFEK